MSYRQDISLRSKSADPEQGSAYEKNILNDKSLRKMTPYDLVDDDTRITFNSDSGSDTPVRGPSLTKAKSMKFKSKSRARAPRMTEYEKNREENIERNRVIMQNLLKGPHGSAANLLKTKPVASEESKKAKGKSTAKGPGLSRVPVRRSALHITEGENPAYR